MKITVIHGSPRKGNTYDITQKFMTEMKKHGDIAFTEIFASSNLPEFCMGCTNCILKGEDKCSHWKYTSPILDAMIDSDAIVMTSPVYVMQVSGTAKSFLDHFGFIFMNHRPRPEMFSKKAFVISTTAGAGTKNAIKTIKSVMQFWGINRIWSLGFSMYSLNWSSMPIKRQNKFNAKIQKSASLFYRDLASGKNHSPYFFTRFMFLVSKFMNKKLMIGTIDNDYWQSMGWLDGKKPF